MTESTPEKRYQKKVTYQRATREEMSGNVWVSAYDAEQLSGLSRTTLKRHAYEGRIEVRRTKTDRWLFRRDQMEQIAAMPKWRSLPSPVAKLAQPVQSQVGEQARSKDIEDMLMSTLTSTPSETTRALEKLQRVESIKTAIASNKLKIAAMQLDNSRLEDELATLTADEDTVPSVEPESNQTSQPERPVYNASIENKPAQTFKPIVSTEPDNYDPAYEVAMNDADLIANTTREMNAMFSR